MKFRTNSNAVLFMEIQSNGDVQVSMEKEGKELCSETLFLANAQALKKYLNANLPEELENEEVNDSRPTTVDGEVLVLGKGTGEATNE